MTDFTAWSYIMYFKIVLLSTSMNSTRVRLVIAKTRYSGHNAKLGKVFPVCHPGDEQGANSPTSGRVVYRSYALRARVLNLACGAMVWKWTYLEDVLLPGWRLLQSDLPGKAIFLLFHTAARAGFPDARAGTRVYECDSI
jgi:hypothetical protein